MKFVLVSLMWLLVFVRVSPVQASPAFGPYGLLETRDLFLAAQIGQSVTTYFGSHRNGSYYVNSSNACALVNRLYELDDSTQTWFPLASFSCSQSTIEIFLREHGQYKIVSTVESAVSESTEYQIEIGLRVYSKFRYYAEDIESCWRFPEHFGWNFRCGTYQCNKTNQNWNLNNDPAYWCKL